MSYSEENGQVILTMSRQDYAELIFRLGLATGYLLREGASIAHDRELLDRLNPNNYTPYKLTEIMAEDGKEPRK